MPAEKFSAHVQKRLSHVATKINSRLEKSDLTAAQKTAIKNDLAAGQAQIAAAVTKVSADGTVTKEEAKQVREVTKTVRKETKAKYGKILPQNADKRKARKERRDQKGDKARREGR